MWLGALSALGVLAVLAGHLLQDQLCRVGVRPLPDASCEAERAVHRTDHPAAEESTPSDEGEASAEQTGDESSTAAPTPERTLARRVGTIEVVDIGAAEESLAGALRAQHELASHRGQTLLVMLTGRRCRPCRGVDDALPDPQLQVALDGVRLVRVDLDVFREEIDLLGIPRDIYPAFFLVGDDHRPRDTIHGGEWGQDIAENIAPVLGAFVRGRYEERRYQRAPTSGSLRL